MNRKQTPIPFLGSGIMLLITLLVVTSLLTFSVLTLLSARNDAQLERRKTEHITAWYAADAQARQVLRAVDRSLSQPDGTRDSLNRLSVPDSIKNLHFDGETLYFETPITEKQTLCVSLRLRLPAEEGKPYYEIIQWQAAASEEWTNDAFLPLID